MFALVVFVVVRCGVVLSVAAGMAVIELPLCCVVFALCRWRCRCHFPLFHRFALKLTNTKTNGEASLLGEAFATIEPKHLPGSKSEYSIVCRHTLFFFFASEP